MASAGWMSPVLVLLATVQAGASGAGPVAVESTRFRVEARETRRAPDPEFPQATTARYTVEVTDKLSGQRRTFDIGVAGYDAAVTPSLHLAASHLAVVAGTGVEVFDLTQGLALRRFVCAGPLTSPGDRWIACPTLLPRFTPKEESGASLRIVDVERADARVVLPETGVLGADTERPLVDEPDARKRLTFTHLTWSPEGRRLVVFWAQGDLVRAPPIEGVSYFIGTVDLSRGLDGVSVTRQPIPTTAFVRPGAPQDAERGLPPFSIEDVRWLDERTLEVRLTCVDERVVPRVRLTVNGPRDGGN